MLPWATEMRCRQAGDGGGWMESSACEDRAASRDIQRESGSDVMRGQCCAAASAQPAFALAAPSFFFGAPALASFVPGNNA